MFFSRTRPAISSLIIAALIGAQVNPLRHALAASVPMSRAEYEACQARDEAGFKKAIKAITRRALRNGLMKIDYAAAVSDAWRRRSITKVIHRQVDKAVENVRNESSWAQLLKSLASKERARELATTVATRVYRSDKVKKAIEQLAVDVGRAIGRHIELATVDAAGPARRCMQTFLGKRFGTTVASVVGANTSSTLDVDASRNQANVTTGKILLESTGGLAGAMVLIVRRQMAKIAARVGQRVLGAVLSRLVSVVAGGVGLVLIAKDIWDLRHGVLPIIASEMKSQDTMARVRAELVREIKVQIEANVDDLADKSADHVVDIWREFQQAHARVLDLAERNEKFKSFMNTIRARHLPRLDQVVALILVSEGEAGVLKRLDNGTLDEAVKRLPDAAIRIARDKRSLEAAFAWSTLAGDQLDKIIRYDIHRHTRPADFTRAGLTKLLALDDELALSRLVGLPRDARRTLFEMPASDLKSLARALSTSQLHALSGYLGGLTRDASHRLLQAVISNPSKMHRLSSARIRNAIMSSADQLSAIDMMVRGESVFDVMTFLDDVSLLREMKVSPWLFWERYPGFLTGLAFFVLLFGFVFWRMLFGRRQKVIVQIPASYDERAATPQEPARQKEGQA